MRNAVYELINGDPEIKTLGVVRVYAAPGIDTPKEECFVVLRWGRGNAEFKNVGTQDLEIWVHKRQADYNRINKILDRIQELMTTTTHRQGSDGVFRQAQWTGNSEDFRDDGFRTFTRNAGYRCNG